MSSRNAYLTSEQQRKALVLYKMFCAARESHFARAVEEVDAADLREAVENVLRSEQLISEVKYVAVDDSETM